MKVPNTVSDEQMKSLQNRAAKVEPPFFSKEAIRRRKHFAAQKDKASQS